MKQIIIAIALTMVSTVSFANSPFGASKVTQIILHDWGYVLVHLEGDVNTAEACANKSTLILYPNHMFFDKQYTAILSAFHSGAQVSGWVDGCDNPYGGPKLTRLDLIK